MVVGDVEDVVAVPPWDNYYHHHPDYHHYQGDSIHHHHTIVHPSWVDVTVRTTGDDFVSHGGGGAEEEGVEGDDDSREVVNMVLTMVVVVVVQPLELREVLVVTYCRGEEEEVVHVAQSCDRTESVSVSSPILPRVETSTTTVNSAPACE
jgi:hypothetical protein